MRASEIFICHTLIDITATGVIRDGTEPSQKKARNQQRNWETFLQVLSLRSQPIILDSTTVTDFSDLSKFEFSSNYAHGRVWTFRFTSEHADSYNLENIKIDSHRVPVILGLDETCKFPLSIIDTMDQVNTYFIKG